MVSASLWSVDLTASDQRCLPSTGSFIAPRLRAMALTARCRAFLKYGELKTWIATLMAHGPPVGLAKGPWVISTKRLVATHQAARRLVPIVGPTARVRSVSALNCWRTQFTVF